MKQDRIKTALTASWHKAECHCPQWFWHLESTLELFYLHVNERWPKKESTRYFKMNRVQVCYKFLKFRSKRRIPFLEATHGSFRILIKWCHNWFCQTVWVICPWPVNTENISLKHLERWGEAEKQRSMRGFFICVRGYKPSCWMGWDDLIGFVWVYYVKTISPSSCIPGLTTMAPEYQMWPFLFNHQ